MAINGRPFPYYPWSLTGAIAIGTAVGLVIHDLAVKFLGL